MVEHSQELFAAGRRAVVWIIAALLPGAPPHADGKPTPTRITWSSTSSHSSGKRGYTPWPRRLFDLRRFGTPGAAKVKRRRLSQRVAPCRQCRGGRALGRRDGDAGRRRVTSRGLGSRRCLHRRGAFRRRSAQSHGLHGGGDRFRLCLWRVGLWRTFAMDGVSGGQVVGGGSDRDRRRVLPHGGRSAWRAASPLGPAVSILLSYLGTSIALLRTPS